MILDMDQVEASIPLLNYSEATKKKVKIEFGYFEKIILTMFKHGPILVVDDNKEMEGYLTLNEFKRDYGVE